MYVLCLKFVCFFILWSSSAQPSTNYSGQSVTHEVELPDDDSSVSTELQCDIQPGAMRQRYSVHWVQIVNSSDIFVGDMFNLTLNVNSSTNGSLYQCHVTINHNGSGLTSIYKGRYIVVITTEGNNNQLTSFFSNILFCSASYLML